MVLIFYFSSQNSTDSSDVSKGVTEKLVDIITSISHIHVEDKQTAAEKIHGLIRKIAHFTIYAALGISAFVSFKLVLGKRKGTVFAITAGFSAIYAVSDEIHQILSDGRSCEIRDVLIDTAGAVTGMLILLAVAAGVKHITNRRRNLI